MTVSIYQKDILILNQIHQKTELESTWNKKLKELKGEIDKFTIIISDFNIPLSTIDRTS